jgi:sugar phosphate isomerase/epimerase
VIGVRVAVQTKCLAQPLRQALHTAGGLGAEGVQLDLRTELPMSETSDTGIRQLRKVLDDLNLRVGSVAFPTRRGYSDPEQIERRLEATTEAMRTASRLHARVIVINLGEIPPADDPRRSMLFEAASTLGRHGNRLGVQVAAQSSSGSATELREFIEALPDGTLGVNLSPADLIHRGELPLDFAATLGPHIAHVFANDAVRGLGRGGALDVELGRGSADFPELLGQMEEYDYRGWITVERRNSAQPVEDVANALQFLRSL